MLTDSQQFKDEPQINVKFFMFLGHIQQGDTPTSFDRSLGVKLGAKAVEWFYDNIAKFKNSDGKICTELPESVMVIGLFGDQYCYTPLEELIPYIDFEYVSLLRFLTYFH